MDMSGSDNDRVIELRRQGSTYQDIMAITELQYHEVQRILTISGMTSPHYKYERQDVIRTVELGEILDGAENVTKFGIPGLGWKAFISIMWLFGKRVSEIIGLRTQDVRVNGEYLAILFTVLKKRSYKDPGMRRPFQKRVTLENPYTETIITWWNREKKEEEKFLFPRSQTKMGYIYRQYAHLVLKEISPKISSHLFRHSLATQMAENGATAYELVNWFDWDRTDTALEYIRRSGAMTEKLSNRKW